MQRLRIRFSRGEEIKYISHLDLLRLWQRALVRADIPLAYSEGFNPHPRMSLAVPLALGVTGEAELMDIFLAKWSSPHSFESAIGRQLPKGNVVTEHLLKANTAYGNEMVMVGQCVQAPQVDAVTVIDILAGERALGGFGEEPDQMAAQRRDRAVSGVMG